jgi:hypothetical protein
MWDFRSLLPGPPPLGILSAVLDAGLHISFTVRGGASVKIGRA